ncbi:MAG: hypothetical protein OEL81_04315, partial [Nitrosopumilus sp.]|nr:hypothetical protein [Nitrosopumilus sp.]
HDVHAGGCKFNSIVNPIPLHVMQVLRFNFEFLRLFTITETMADPNKPAKKMKIPTVTSI